jgi:1,2-diacylglycerol 3-beta-galactosyltransferase
MYPWMSGMSKSWGRGWTQSNDPQRVQRFMKLWWPYIRTACIRMAKEPCDAVINVQPLYTFPVLWAMDRIGVRKPFVTMVSDLIVVHAAWCEPTADRLLVPTEVSRVHALEHHMPPDKIQIVGLPIRLLFMNPPEPKPSVRQRLGLKDKFTVLLMGGGQGLGRVYEIAEAIGHSGLDVQLIVERAARRRQLADRSRSLRFHAGHPGVDGRLRRAHHQSRPHDHLRSIHAPPAHYHQRLHPLAGK